MSDDENVFGNLFPFRRDKLCGTLVNRQTRGTRRINRVSPHLNFRANKSRSGQFASLLSEFYEQKLTRFISSDLSECSSSERVEWIKLTNSSRREERKRKGARRYFPYFRCSAKVERLRHSDSQLAIDDKLTRGSSELNRGLLRREIWARCYVLHSRKTLHQAF